MIVRDPSCIHELQWRLIEPPPFDLIGKRLERRGFDRLDYGKFLVFYSSEGHKVILVPSTGRVQFRLDVDTPKSLRAETAMRIAAWTLGLDP